MPRYFLHLRDRIDEVLDPEGIVMSAEAVAGAALMAARDCMAGDVMKGRLNLHYRIEVENDLGETVHVTSFADAVEIDPPR